MLVPVASILAAYFFVNISLRAFNAEKNKKLADSTFRFLMKNIEKKNYFFFLIEKILKKTFSYKYIRREKSATKKGHRQNYLNLKIKSVHNGA